MANADVKRSYSLSTVSANDQTQAHPLTAKINNFTEICKYFDTVADLPEKVDRRNKEAIIPYYRTLEALKEEFDAPGGSRKDRRWVRAQDSATLDFDSRVCTQQLCQLMHPVLELMRTEIKEDKKRYGITSEPAVLEVQRRMVEVWTKVSQKLR